MKELTNISELKAAGPRVIVSVEPIKDKTEGGILLTDETRRREQDTISHGVLIDKGEAAFKEMCSLDHEPMNGDSVYFVKYAGKEIKIEENYYRIINDEDIFAYKIGEKQNA
jgi:co-chaperonin GroES (HSP10)